MRVNWNRIIHADEDVAVEMNTVFAAFHHLFDFGSLAINQRAKLILSWSSALAQMIYQTRRQKFRPRATRLSTTERVQHSRIIPIRRGWFSLTSTFALAPLIFSSAFPTGLPFFRVSFFRGQWYRPFK